MADEIIKKPVTEVAKEAYNNGVILGVQGGKAVTYDAKELVESNLTFGKVEQGDNNVVSGGEVYDSIKDFSSGIIPINLNTATPTKDGVFEPLEVGVYPNFGGSELTQQEKDNNIVYFYLLNGVFSKQVKTVQTSDVIESNNTNAVSSRGVYNWTVRNIKNIAELRTIQGEEGQEINLLGYYEAGDKPSLLYKWVSGTAEDDGGSVIESVGGYWSACFVDSVDSRDFKDIEKALNVSSAKKITLLLNDNYEIKNTTSDLKEIDIYSIIGNGYSLILNGIITLKSKYDTIDIKDTNFVVKNYFGTNSFRIDFEKRKYIITKDKKGKSTYSNLTFKADVSTSDGSERGYGCINDISDNIIAKNITSYNFQNCLYINDSDGIIIKNIKAFNNGTTVNLNRHGMAQVSNVYLINNNTQCRNWIGKDIGVGSNGQDAILCIGDDIRMTNIKAFNPVERTIYCQSSNVDADNLYCLNGDGFKFVGIRSKGIVNKKINVNDCLLEIDDTFNSTIVINNIGMHQIYLTEEIKITNSKSITTTDIGYCIRTSEYNKKLTIKDFDVFSRQPLLYITTNTNSEVPFLMEDISIQDSIITMNNTASKYDGCLLSFVGVTNNDIKASNVNIENNKIQYTENATKCDFMYDFRNCYSFYAKDNKQNVIGSSNTGFFVSFRDITDRDINIFDDVIVNSINASLNVINRYLFNNCKIKLIKNSNILTYSINNNVSELIKVDTNSGYFQLDIPNLSAVVESVYKGNKYIGSLSNNVKTDVLATDIDNLIRYNNNKIEVRGDLNTFKYDVEITLTT